MSGRDGEGWDEQSLQTEGCCAVVDADEMRGVVALRTDDRNAPPVEQTACTRSV